jgi:outer membrane protein assembly factor BamB
MNVVTRILVPVTLILVWASLASASDWNQWRGSNRSGLQNDGIKLMDVWKKGPATLWISEPMPSGDDSGYSSPVVANGKVYQFINWKRYPGGGTKDVIFCLDEKDGSTLWKVVYPGQEFGNGTTATPAVVNGKVYVVGGAGLYCLDADKGTEIWKTPPLGGDISSSPAVVSGVVVVGAQTLRGFDAATGKQLWECLAAGRNNITSPGVWKAGTSAYILMNMEKFVCVDPKDGAVVWTGDHGGGWSTPTVNGDYVVLGDGISVFKLSPQKGEKLFSSGLGDRAASMMIYDQHVYSNCWGTLRCQDFTGKVLWEQGGGDQIGSLVGADGKGFLVSGDRRVAMFALTPEKPRVYQAVIPAGPFTTPAIADGKMFLHLSGGKGVGCFDLTAEPQPKPGEIDRSAWNVTAVAGPNPENVVSDTGIRWTTERAMVAGDWLLLDMLKTYKLKQVVLDSSTSPNDAAQGVQLWLSIDGTNFTKAAELTVEQTKAMNGLVKFDLPSTEARYIKFVNMGSNGPSWWSVTDVRMTVETP